MATGSRTLKLSILADVDQLNKSLKAANSDVENSSNTISDFGRKAGLAFAAAAAAAGTMAIKLGIDSIKAASDLNETVSKVGVIFGSSAKAINDFAATAATKLGQTKQQALDAAATFATFGKAAGLSGDDLVKFSTGFTKLASDLASFNNTSPEQAINAIGAALRGESEPLRAYGVLLDDASMRQAALELGIVSTTKNALTPQQKVLAAQELIYRQTAAAQGDFERTSDGLANKQRILTAQLENMKTVIGNALLPIVLELATVFSTKVLPVIQNIADAFSDKTGGIGANIQTLGTIITNTFTPIWNGLVKAFGYVKDAIGDNMDSFMAFGKLIATYVAPILSNTLGTALQIAGKIASGVIDVIGGIIGAVTGAVTGAIKAINWLIEKYNSIPLLPNIPTIPVSAAPSVSIPKPSTSGINIPSLPAAPSLPSGGSSSGGGGGGVAAAAKSVAAAAASTNNVVTGSFGAGSFRMGEAATMGTVINLTVTGAIDSEGTARTIVDTLNNSTYRGTGGSSNFVAV